MMQKIDYDTQTQAVIDAIRSGKISLPDGAFKLLAVHRGLIYRITSPFNIEHSEADSIGFIALVNAITQWDGTKGRFINYLTWSLRNELRKLLRGCPPKEIQQISLSEPISEAESITLGDTLADDVDYECLILDEINREQLRDDIAQMLSQLSIEQRRAVTERFFEGQKVNDRSTYQKAMRTISTARNRRILSQYLERNDYFSGTGLSNFRRTGSTMPERIIIQIHDGR